MKHVWKFPKKKNNMSRKLEKKIFSLQNKMYNCAESCLEIKKKVDVLSYPNAIFNEKKKQI
jgi:hypothetical protein